MRAAGRSLIAGRYPASKHWTTAGQWDLLPGGHKAKGVNIWVRAGTYHDGTAMPNYLADFWHQWEWSAPGAFAATGNLILPQLQLAKSIGCNYVRFFGTSLGRNPASGYANILPDTQYFNQWQQLLDWCRANGMYCYPTLEHDSDNSIGSAYLNYSALNSWRIPEWQHLMRLFAAYLDVIVGVDMMNEAYGWATQTSDTSYNNPGGNVFNAITAYNALKPIVPTLPLTISTYFKAQPNQANPWTANVGGQRLPVQNVLDFNDCHIYYDAAASDFDVVLSQSNQPMLIGEFGTTVSAGTAGRQSRYNGVLGVVNTVTSGRQAAGAAPWCMTDYWSTTDDQYGLADASGNVRADVQSIFQSFPS